MKRDSERTRQRILAAALREFAGKGFAGARVDAIARRARVNKRMLYHYFGDKNDLYREVVRRKLAEKTRVTRANPDDPAEAMPYWYEETLSDPDWVRLLGWEALGGGPPSPIDDKGHRQVYRAALEWLELAQARGFLSPDLDPKHVMLGFIALNMFPLAFPQIAKATTGLTPTDPLFVRRHATFARRLAEHLRPRPTGRTERGASSDVSLEPSGHGEAR